MCKFVSVGQKDYEVGWIADHHCVPFCLHIGGRNTAWPGDKMLPVFTQKKTVT